MTCPPKACTWCQRPAARGELCWAHAGRRRRGTSMTRPVRPDTRGKKRHGGLMEAALAYADADGSDAQAYRRAWDRLRKAALAYAQAIRGLESNPKAGQSDKA